MATGVSSDLRDFHEFIGQKLASGSASLSPEAALDEWRSDHPDPRELAESLGALREALEEADRGEGIPLGDAIEEIRRRHKLPNISLEE